MSFQPFTHQLPNGEAFLATSRIDPDWEPYGNHDEDTIRALVSELWNRAHMGRYPWQERWKRNDLYFNGFHWDTPQRRIANSTTNFCNEYVDALWSILTDGRPRPEIVPSSGMKYETAMVLQEAARWMMNASQFDESVSSGLLDFARLGNAPFLFVFDEYGLCWPKSFSPYHFYPDPAAQADEELEFFFIARPWNTRLLRARFPSHADRITPDGLVSCEYEVFERPLADEIGPYGRSTFGGAFVDMIGPASSLGDPTPPGSAILLNGLSSGGQWRETTFVVELHIRDHTQAWTTFAGETRRFDADSNAFVTTNPSAYARRMEPLCESGWRVIPMTAGGVLLPDFAVDACFGGPAIEVMRYRKINGQFWSKSLLDDAVPVNRDYNTHQTMLKRAIAFNGLPAVRMDKNAGTDLDDAPLEPGDIIKTNVGATLEAISLGSIGQGGFDMLQMILANGQRVTGIQDAMIGRQPGSANTGVAIRELQQAGESRIRANENPLHFALKRILKKCMMATGKKLNRAIMFKSMDGRSIELDPEALRNEYDVTFTLGSGTAPGRRQTADEAMALAGAGVIDGPAVLDALDYPGRNQITMRMQAAAQAQAVAQAQAASKAPPPQGG